MLALRLFGRVAGYRLGRWLRLVCRLVLGRWAFASRLLVSWRSSRLCVSCCSSRSGAVCGGEALLVCHAVSSERCSHCHLSYLWRLGVVIIVSGGCVICALAGCSTRLVGRGVYRSGGGVSCSTI